jgi:hypothetical protein
MSGQQLRQAGRGLRCTCRASRAADETSKSKSKKAKRLSTRQSAGLRIVTIHITLGQFSSEQVAVSQRLGIPAALGTCRGWHVPASELGRALPQWDGI